MATLILMGAGAAIAGSGSFAFLGTTIAASTVGATIGGFVGSYIDNTFVFPALFGQQQELEGPKLEELRIQSASEGSPIHYCQGPNCRVAGTIIFCSPLTEVEQEEEAGSGKKKAEYSTYTYFVDIAIAVAEGDIKEIKKIWADSELIFDSENEEAYDKVFYETLVRYNGTLTQEPDPLLQSHLTADYTPGFRGIAYVVIEKLNITKFGNRIPQFNFLVEAHEELTVADAIKKILYRSNFGDEVIDVTRVNSDLKVEGYTMAGPQYPIRCLETLLLAYNIVVRESEGKLVFISREDSDTIDVPMNDLGYYERGDGSGHKRILLTERATRDLPSEVTVSYIDPDLDYQTAQEKVRRHHYLTPTTRGYDVPLVMTSTQANSLGARLLFTEWSEKTEVEFTLPPTYIYAEEGDLFNVAYSENEAYLIRSTDVTIGNNYLVRVRGILEGAETLSHDLEGDIPRGYVPPDRPHAIGTLTLHLMDIPALHDSQTQEVGFYYAVAFEEPEPIYTGGSLYVSEDGVNYRSVGPLPPREVTSGVTLTALPPGTTTAIDTTNTVDVELVHGTLSSVTEAELLNSTVNRALIGDEIVGFQTATLIGPNTYRLSNLIRGERDTIDHIGTHAVGDRFVLLKAGPIEFYRMGFYNVSQTRYWKAVPNGGFLADAPAVEFTGTGRTVAPFRPINIHRVPENETGNDIYVTWTPQSRALALPFNPLSAPLLEPTESYIVEFWQGATYPGTTLRKVTVTGGVRFYHYTEAMQATDGRDPMEAVNVRITQVSQYDTTPGALGNPGEATFM